MDVYRYLVKGRVQGVGFRNYVLRKAQLLDLKGWVRNLSDGRVEILVSFSHLVNAESREQFELWIRRGPDSSEVSEVLAKEEEFKSELKPKFEIRY